MTHKPTNLEDARALKRMGVALNTPVEKREFSAAYSKHWFKLMDAHAAFMVAAYGDISTPRAWRHLCRHLRRLDRAAVRCLDYAKADAAEGQDRDEHALMGWFVIERAVPFITYWDEALAAAEDGAELAIRPGDVPRWTDED